MSRLDKKMHQLAFPLPYVLKRELGDLQRGVIHTTLTALKVRKNQKQFGRAVDSPKKQTNEFGLFAVKSKKANKTNSFVRFLGESMMRQSAFEIK